MTDCNQLAICKLLSPCLELTPLHLAIQRLVLLTSYFKKNYYHGIGTSNVTKKTSDRAEQTNNINTSNNLRKIQQ